VCTQTVRCWLAEGLLPAEQTAPHAPWRIRFSDDVRGRFVPDVSETYVKRDDAARQLGVARQTVLTTSPRRSTRRRPVVPGKRRGLRIEIGPGEQRLLPTSSAADRSSSPGRDRVSGKPVAQGEDRFQAYA
jgi:hypothetical protein